MEKEKAGKFVVLVSKQDVRKEVSGDMALKTQGRGGGRSRRQHLLIIRYDIINVWYYCCYY